MEQFIILILVLLLFTVPACVILSKKNRGWGYYLLAFLYPLIGLIVALCLKKLEPKENKAKTPSLDITENEKLL